MESQLIRVGNTVINLALIIRWDIDEGEELSGDGLIERPQPTGQKFDKVRVKYSNGEYEWFEREQATALRRWLEATAQDLMAPPGESPGAHL